MAKPAFIVFEGGEGSGKSTQATILKRRLLRQGFPVVLTREPGGTPVGNRLRRWLKWGSEITPQTELLLILAARSQLVTGVVRPALEKGSLVICDRYAYSTLAYQGYGRGMDRGFLESLNTFVTGGLVPDLVVLLNSDPAEGLRRKTSRRDRFEREDLSFHQRVREGYLRMAAADPERWLVVDASLPRNEVRELIWERVQQFLD
ncbi:MAG: dTMP kinase [Chloroflexota bacterium]|nr:dTMP kinase [Chloroflexota bacterium]